MQRFSEETDVEDMRGSRTSRFTCSGVSGDLGMTPGLEAAAGGGVEGRSPMTGQTKDKTESDAGRDW